MRRARFKKHWFDPPPPPQIYVFFFFFLGIFPEISGTVYHNPGLCLLLCSDTSLEQIQWGCFTMLNNRKPRWINECIIHMFTANMRSLLCALFHLFSLHPFIVRIILIAIMTHTPGPHNDHGKGRGCPGKFMWPLLGGKIACRQSSKNAWEHCCEWELLSDDESNMQQSDLLSHARFTRRN